jgi:hypothetical protein
MAKKLSKQILHKKIRFGSQNRPELGKPKTDLLKTDRRSVLGLLKTDRFRSRFLAGLYYNATYQRILHDHCIVHETTPSFLMRCD